MLTLLGPTGRFCDGVSRRGFLSLGALGLGGLTLPGVLRARAAQSSAARKNTAVILYWQGGGPSQLDTYDPKPNAPAEVRGPFASIPTRFPGLRFCELLPEHARIADKLTVLRSLTHHEPNHPDAAHLVQTGYHEKNVQFRGQIYPAQGSIVAKLRGANQPGLPPYVCIPQAYNARQGFFQLATYLGKEFDPVNSGGEPGFRGKVNADFALPENLSVERVEDRRALLRRIDATAKQVEPAVAGMDAAYQKAFELVTSPAAKEAFDLSREPVAMRERYGENTWGRNALLARRLVEAGVTFVTLNHYEADVDWWDDHTVIEKGLRKRLPPFDRSVTALIEDIHARGLAERVLVIVMGEFGRSPRIDSGAGRGHWSKAMSAVLSGGGIRGGRAVGATTANAGEPATHPYSPGDLLATVYQHLGIDPTHMLPDRQNRPVRLVEHGEVIRELFGHQRCASRWSPDAHQILADLRFRIDAQVIPQLANRFVLFVAHSLGGRLQFHGDVWHRPSIGGHFYDLPLTRTQHDLGREIQRISLIAKGIRIAVVFVPHIDGKIAVSALSLTSLLHRIDRSEELFPFLGFVVHHVVPLVHRDPFQEPGKHLLRAVGPTVGRHAGISPTGLAITGNVLNHIGTGIGARREAARFRGRHGLRFASADRQRGA